MRYINKAFYYYYLLNIYIYIFAIFQKFRIYIYIHFLNFFIQKTLFSYISAHLELKLVTSRQKFILNKFNFYIVLQIA